MLKKILILALLVSFSIKGWSQVPVGIVVANGTQGINIIPQPVEIKRFIEGDLVIDAKTKIGSNEFTTLNAGSFLRDYLQTHYGLKLNRSIKDKEGNEIHLQLRENPAQKKGGYVLDVKKNGINIYGNSAEGIFNGIQSLIQLLPTPDTNTNIENYKIAIHDKGLRVPCITITDEPRFAYRGMHLDVCRHFFPVSFVKKYIDYLALHKMNYFHWHLTDDQGWRIEIKKYPLLTKVGGYRNGTIVGHHPGTSNDNTPYEGFYTQEEIKDVVAYAAARYITIIPEIELPGHASAAIAAYPKLSCFPEKATVLEGPVSNAGSQKGIKKVQQTWGVFEDVFCPSEFTFHFLEDVMDEVVALFPSKYIHVGGDECPKEAWKKSGFCQTLMKSKGLKNEHELQSYFIGRVEKYLNSKGRNIIGWDEILEGGLAPNATVMSWRGEEGGIAAAKQGHNVIMTPGSYVYFDHSQTKNDDSITIGGYTTVQKVYGYEPIPAAVVGDNRKYILGAQANMWTEYISSPAKVEYQLFPRMSALSEVLWSSPEKGNWADFEKRLLNQFRRYNLWGAKYSRALFHPANK